MEKALQIVKLLCYACLGFAAVSIAIVVLELRPVIAGLKTDVQEAHRVLLESALTAKEARLASSEERVFLSKTLPVMSDQVTKVLNTTSNTIEGVHKDTNALNDLIVATTDNTSHLTADTHQTLMALEDTLQGIQPAEQQLNNTIRDTDQFISSPEIKDTITNIDKSSISMAKAMDHTDQTTGELQKEVHAITHPKVITQIFNWTLKIVRVFPF